jgi:hypothetical protein
MCSSATIEREFKGLRRENFGACEIERRPRGASRMNPLLHLLQRAEPVTPWLPALAHGLSPTDKADNHGFTGVATLQQM